MKVKDVLFLSQLTFQDVCLIYFCFASLLYSAARVASRHSSLRVVAFSSGPKLPLGLEKVLGEPDNLIPTDKMRKTAVGHIPDFATEDVKKDLQELGLDGIEDLDELEEKNMEGYNDLGLVPPEGSGTYSSPILIPSRYDTRQVGYQDPETHAMYWFNIHNDNNTYYIKDLGLFFKMLHIPDPQAHAGHH